MAPDSGADGNGNGIIDAADYTLWRDQFGNTASSATQPVPEPGASALAACALLVYVGTMRLWRKCSDHSGGF